MSLPCQATAAWYGTVRLGRLHFGCTVAEGKTQLREITQSHANEISNFVRF